MVTFATYAEMRALGAPVVRLFRAALGRDPEPAELAAGVAALRDGGTAADLARKLAATAEFARLHGPDAPPDEPFLARVQRWILGPLADEEEENRRREERVGLLAGSLRAVVGVTRGELAAVLAESGPGRARIPLLPGLAPGAPPDDPVAYRFWVEEYDNPDPAALARLPVPSGPRVVVATVAGDTEAEAAIRTVESLRRQTYPDWECRLVHRLRSPWPREALARLAAEEPRLRLLDPPAASSRAAALAEALTRLSADGEALFCFLDAGDRLAPTALHEVVEAASARPDALLLYSDEDVMDGAARRAPRFKPGPSPDALLAGDFVGQLAVYRATLLERVGAPRAEASPHDLYDLALRAMAFAGPGRVHHIPAVLCHRAAPGPAVLPVPAAALPRAAPDLAALEGPSWPRVRFRLPEPTPLVSILVLTRDRPELLAACASGVLERTDYSALELLVVDNGSADEEALDLLARLEETPRARVLRRPGPFNFAALNNAAAAEARGDVLLLLNNDTEVLRPDWLAEMASHAVRPDVGAVGVRLLYPDGTLQHAGLLLGPDGTATHVGRGAAPDDPGYLGQLACTRDLSAVTGACLAMRRDVFRTLGGMDERLAVTWNDVDLCLRVRAAGLRVVWTPHAVLLHHESASRGAEAADPAKLARFREEQALVRATWGEALDRDPFLNPNLLATEAGPLVLTRPRHARPWHIPAGRPPAGR